MDLQAQLNSGSHLISFLLISPSSSPIWFSFLGFGLFGPITMERSIMIAQYSSYKLST